MLEVGTLAEAVTVTAEVTPVNTTTGSLQRNMTGDQLTMIQVKGRDIFGMMKILPGVSDTTFSRDYAAWQSGRGLSINGGTSLNKNTTIDGVSVGEEGGDGTTHVTPNLDSIGEVTVITNGYTAENGRQSSGLIRIVTKSGTNQLKGSAWYNARRDEWNANDYFRKKQGAEKPFFEVDISGLQHRRPRGHSEASRQPLDREESVLLPLSGVRRRCPADQRCCGRTCRLRPSGRGDFSQTRVTNGTIQPIIDPLTGQPFPGNIIPQNRIHPMGQQMLNLLPLPNGVINQAGRSAVDVERRAGHDAHSQAPQLHHAHRRGAERQSAVQRADDPRPRRQHHVQPCRARRRLAQQRVSRATSSAARTARC